MKKIEFSANNKLIELRETLKLTQEEFAKRINLTKFTISNYENGKRKIPDRVVMDICREFNVNEQWLCSDAEDMFIEISCKEIEELSKKYNLHPMTQEVIKNFTLLGEQDMRSVLDYVKYLAYQKEKTQLDSKKTSLDDTEISQELADYKLELEAEKKGRTASAVTKESEKENNHKRKNA